MIALTVSWVLLLNVVELTVMPVPENDTVAPLTKFVPATVPSPGPAPWEPEDGFIEVVVGPVLTVKHPVHDALPVSGFVTVTLRAPVVAPTAIEMFAVTWVALLNVVEFTVMPVPENEALAPLWKPVPVIAMSWLIAPWPRELGLVEVTVGRALTVKHPVHDPVPASVLVTVTSRAPVVAPPAMVMLAVTWVALLKVVELTVMPVPENDAFAPLTKFVPVITMF